MVITGTFGATVVLTISDQWKFLFWLTVPNYAFIFRIQLLRQKEVIVKNLILHIQDIKMEEEIGTNNEGGIMLSSASEEPPGILKLEDEDGTCDEGEIISGSASEEPPGILKLEDADGTCDEEGNRSSPAPEEPLGILQLIDQLENIVDTLLPG